MRFNALKSNHEGGNNHLTKEMCEGPVVAFLDADVCHLGPLPRFPISFSSRCCCSANDKTAAPLLGSGSTDQIPWACPVALSPHHIHWRDAAIFGLFNGGYVVVSDPVALLVWRRHAFSSRYFDQAALEGVWDWAAEKTAASNVCQCPYLISPNHNYGYWRLFQTNESRVQVEARKFSLQPYCREGMPTEGASAHKAEEVRGRSLVIHYQGTPLRSVHTHFFAPVGNAFTFGVKGECGDSTTNKCSAMELFNSLIIQWMRECVDSSSNNDNAAANQRDYCSAYRKILSILDDLQ